MEHVKKFGIVALLIGLGSCFGIVSTLVVGGVVSYADAVKRELLDVSAAMLAGSALGA